MKYSLLHNSHIFVTISSSQTKLLFRVFMHFVLILFYCCIFYFTALLYVIIFVNCHSNFEELVTNGSVSLCTKIQ